MPSRCQADRLCHGIDLKPGCPPLRVRPVEGASARSPSSTSTWSNPDRVQKRVWFSMNILPPFSGCRKQKTLHPLRGEGNSAVPPCLPGPDVTPGSAALIRVIGRNPPQANGAQLGNPSPASPARQYCAVLLPGGKASSACGTPLGTLPGSHLSLPARWRKAYYSLP